MRGVLLGALLLAAGSAFADAWPRGSGTIYVHSGLAQARATEAFDPIGARIPFPGRGGAQQRASLYIEAGMSDHLTLVANLPYQRVTARGFFNDFTTTGLADLDLRLRESRRTAAGVVALEAGAMIPLGYDRTDFPQLGSGRAEPIVNFAYGTSVAALPEGFASLQIGYRWRAREIGDELPWSAKVGAFPHKRLGIFAFARGWQSRGDFGTARTTYALETASSEETRAGAELYVHATRSFDVNATWSRTLGGLNTAISSEVSVGVAFHRQR